MFGNTGWPSYLMEPTVTKNRCASCCKINFSGAGHNSVLVVLLGTLILFSLAGCATSLQSNSQTMVHETGHRTLSLDLSKTTRASWTTESGDIQKTIGRDPRDNWQVAYIQQHLQNEARLFAAGDFSGQDVFYCTDTLGIKELASQVTAHRTPLPSHAEITFTAQDPNLITAIHGWFGAQQPDQGGDSLWIAGEQEENFCLAHRLTDRDSAKQQDLLNGNIPDRGCTLPAEEKALSNQEKKALTDLPPDWKGIGRDTAYFMGYQVVVAGTLWVLPESVTKWTDEQKRATLNKWAKNVQSATWDKDPAWINYIGHPYWGATYYIRARERGFDEFGSFLYSALLSALYEYGIEAFFERPSYQDLIVTPVGGTLIGKFIFEPIRASIKSKAELAWSDHLLLILTDPLGAANGLVNRSLGIESNVRLAIPGLTPPLRVDHSSYHAARSLKRQDDNRSHQNGFGIGFNFRW